MSTSKKKRFELNADELIEAFLMAYDEIAENETFPIRNRDVKLFKNGLFTSSLELRDSYALNWMSFYIEYYGYDNDHLSMNLTRISYIEIDKYKISFFRSVSSKIKEDPKMKDGYSFYKEEISKMFNKIEIVKHGESGEIIKSMTERLLNLYESGYVIRYDSSTIGAIVNEKEDEYKLRYNSDEYEDKVEFIKNGIMPSGEPVSKEELDYYSTGKELYD